jgi:hypothetical protein
MSMTSPTASTPRHLGASWTGLATSTTAAVKEDQLTHPVYHDLINSHQHYLVSILALIIVCLAVVISLLFVYGKRSRNDLQSDLRQGKQAIRQLEEDVAHLRQLALTGPIQQIQRYQPRVHQQAPLFPPTAPAQVIPRPDPEPIVPGSHVHIHVGAGHQPSAVCFSARVPEEMALLPSVSEPLPPLH